MNTTMIHLKTKKELKEHAKKLADRLGLTLTGLINLHLAQLVEASQITIQLEPQPNAKTTKELLKLKRDVEAGKNLSPAFTDPNEAIKWLRS